MIKALLSLLLLSAGTWAAWRALSHRRWEVPGAALAASGATAWTLTNGRFEGPVLLAASAGNGLTTADLLSLPALALTALLVVRAFRR